MPTVSAMPFFFAFVGIIAAFAISRTVSRTKLVGAALALLMGFAAYSQWYQLEYRNADQWSRYVNFRIDYGRDGDITFAIYTELYLPDEPILEYRTQSFLFDSLFFVPRHLWTSKPLPYSYYVTSRALGIPLSPGLRTGLTTSILGESIANLGWLGIPGVLVLLGVLCRIGDHSRSVLYMLTITCIAVLLLVLHVNNILPFMGIWMVLTVRRIFAGVIFRASNCGVFARAKAQRLNHA